MVERRRVLVACCNGRGWIHKRVVFSVIKMLQDPRHTPNFIAPTHSPFVQNLHLTVHDFLAQGHDFLLLVDDDNPPINNPLDLVELDLDVIGLPTPVWNNAVPGDRPYYYNALVRASDGNFKPANPLEGLEEGESPGLVEVEAVGGGCMLIARRVLLELMKRCKGSPSDAPFMRIWNDKGTVESGNDYAFCTRAKAAGFRIWTHFGYPCEHWNELEISEVFTAFGEING